MEQTSYYINILSLLAIGACWAVFGSALIYRRSGSTTDTRSREPLSWLGLVLQLISFPLSWAGWRSPLFSPVIEGQYVVNIMLQLMAIALAAFSAWMAWSAIRELGKQWSLQARVLEDHKLITTGIYGTVRHPIYTAMLGMLIATGIVISHRLALGVGIVIFLAGTKIRMRLEERLLEKAFGERFREWTKAVPALIPFSTWRN